ncbi:MAG TPA: S41 family peptidase [Nitrospirales bacterium]|nr:S41 family peptidase [Nitrospirales bacterium]
METQETPTHRSRWMSVSIIGALLIGVLVGRTLVPVVLQATEPYEHLKTFTEVLAQIEKNYVEETKSVDLIHGAIRGMLATLDPHSGYMPPDVYKEVQVETKGKFGGVGIQIGIRDKKLTVVAPIEGTPAYRAGIQSLDFIFKVDGESTKDMTLLDAVHLMRGPKGTKVTLTVIREGVDEEIVVDLIRDEITIQSVRGRMLEDDIGYLRIAQFQEQTAKEQEKILSELKEKGMKSLIIDLRNNPGGLLSAAVGVTEQFIPSGKLVVSIKNRQGKRDEYRANAGDPLTDIPIVVLVNAGSASGSEILAGAFQDWGRAVVVGTQTFGKGSVQTILPLSDGSGLRLTTAKYFTPDDRSIHGIGITPGIKVEGTSALTHPAVENAEGSKSSSVAERDADVEKTTEEREQELIDKDVQLQKAIEILKTWNVFKAITPRA